MTLDLALAALGVTALLVRVGFALYAAGLVRSKNSAGMVTRLLCDLCLSTLVFWGIGASILFQQHNSVFALRADLLFANISSSKPFIEFLFFQLAMNLIASGAMAGATAERFRFFPLCGASILLSGLLLPVAGNWAWYGWLASRGFIDIGGGTALHVTAGVSAAVAAVLVGARTGKFNRDGSSSMIPGHNLPLAGVGAMLIFVGWVAYIAGAGLMVGVRPLNPFPQQAMEIASPGALNALLSASAAGFLALLIGQLRYGKPDVVLGLMGFIGGLVAISSGAGLVSAPGAAMIGAVVGIFLPIVTVALDLRLRIDDPTGVIAMYALAGAWGTLATAFFIPAMGMSRWHQFGVQLVGVLSIALFSAIVSFLVFGALKYTVGIRAREADEFDGLDLAEHDIGAYPDFQQTMIKSYHLREM